MKGSVSDENLNPCDQAHDRDITTNPSRSRFETTKQQAPLPAPFFQVYFRTVRGVRTALQNGISSVEVIGYIMNR